MKVLGARGCSVCVSRTDYLILLGPSHQSTVLFTAPRSINHLFTQLEDYSRSFATSSLSCHGASQGRHRHSCIKVIRLLSPWQQSGWMGALLPHFHQHPPTGVAGLGCLHLQLHAFQPRLTVTVDEGRSSVTGWGRCAQLSPLNKTLLLFLGDKIQSIVCLLGAC